jgi:hypothetical protein
VGELIGYQFLLGGEGDVFGEFFEGLEIVGQAGGVELVGREEGLAELAELGEGHQARSSGGA